MLASWWLVLGMVFVVALVDVGIAVVGLSLKVQDSVKAITELFEISSLIICLVVPYLGLVVALDIRHPLIRGYEEAVMRLGTGMCCTAAASFFYIA
jgi:hypothetical protein